MTILVVGDVNADVTAILTRFPAEGDDITVSRLSWGGGGSAANAAVALGRLGLAARLFARVSDDPTSVVALRAARQAGVDLAHLQHDAEHATGLCYAAISPSGERTFFAYRGANLWLEAGDAIIDACLAGATWLHVSGHGLIEGRQRATTLQLIDAAHRRGIPISLDTCLPLLHAERESTLALLPRLAILFANEPELMLLAYGPGAAAAMDVSVSAAAIIASTQALAAQGAALVVGKWGPHGCIYTAAHETRHVPGFQVVVADTNGCGDAFVAGFLGAYTSRAPLQTCATIGNACGALTATRPGAAEALPAADQVRAFLLEYAITWPWDT